MGTNYYYRTNVCQHCDRSDMRHVGLVSAGWTFQFRAYRIETGADQDIVKVADWARLFKTVPGVLVTEYGTVIEHPLQFLAELEHPTEYQKKVENQRIGRHLSIDSNREWRDDEGFYFYDGEFC